MNKKRLTFYKDHPKTCSPDDFWGQVKRTVNGTPVSQDQIDMIVAAIVAGLELGQEDNLLDLCCGNGALSTLLFKQCKGGLGVDFSEYLISIANKYFAAPPDQVYILQDVVEFCENPTMPRKFSKMVCYGSFPFIEHERAEAMLCLLKRNFPNVERIFIGNCPDKDLLAEFLGDRSFTPGTENDPDSPIGIWRTQEEFVSLAKRCGWLATIHKMPSQYYAAHYRYDVILSK
jgi:SAM-dependent methyltransferase